MIVSGAPVNEWVRVHDSTLVRALKFDQAAQRIYVRNHSRQLWVYEDCSDLDWTLLMTFGISKGEYIMNVLDRHRNRFLDGA